MKHQQLELEKEGKALFQGRFPGFEEIGRMKELRAASDVQGPVTPRHYPDLPWSVSAITSAPRLRRRGQPGDRALLDQHRPSPLLTVAQRVLATAKIIILHMTYRFFFLSLTKNKTAELTFAQSSLVNFSSL